MIALLYISGLLALILTASALLEERFVAFEPSFGALALSNATILFATHDFVGIEVAVNSLVDDFEQILGVRIPQFTVTSQNVSRTIYDNNASTAIIIGSVSRSFLIQDIASAGRLDLANVDDQWETYQTAVVTNPLPGLDRAFVIAGSDLRGAMFGVYTLCEQSGQSPFHYWTDTPAHEHDEIYALPRTTIHGPPSVRYRGLFINDEAPSLTTWWSQGNNKKHQPLDAAFYTHVFDMMLRLKANYIWPAMWKSSNNPPGNIFFTDDPENMALAEKYGIVVSTSHHEPMQRATNEWNVSETGEWDWSINKANVTRFMDAGIRRAAGQVSNASYVTLGMRGAGDGPIEGDNATDILRDVFSAQRTIIQKYYGAADAVPQLWTIYKEVATYYAAGLAPPDDVTLMFTDDNWGNIQRLPVDVSGEVTRSGGIGVYYHLEYVGAPRPHKWQDTNHLPKVLKELSQAYMRGARQIWVINVADIKPMELPYGFIMDLAWNASSITFGSLPRYLELWAAREFGPALSVDIAKLVMDWNQLLGMRKFEMIRSDTFSLENYHEVERMLAAWQDLVDREDSLYRALDKDRQATFFHYLHYPIQSGNIYYKVTLGQTMNAQYAIQRRNTANAVAERVMDDFGRDFDLIEEYDQLMDGKWKHILSQPKFEYSSPVNDKESWKSPSRDVLSNLSYVQLRQNMDESIGNLGIQIENTYNARAMGRWNPSAHRVMPTDGDSDYGGMPLMQSMNPYSGSSRRVDLFMRGDHRVPVRWWLDEWEHDWLSVNPVSGNLTQRRPEQILNFTVNWPQVPAGFNETVCVQIRWDGDYYWDYIRLPIQNRLVPPSFRGFPEVDAGVVSIEAAHYQRAAPQAINDTILANQPEQPVAFVQFPYLATRSNSGSIAVRPYQASRARINEGPASQGGQASPGFQNTTEGLQPPSALPPANNSSSTNLTAINPPSTAAATTALVQYDIFLFNYTEYPVNATAYVTSCLDTDPTLPMYYSLTADAQPPIWTRVLPEPRIPGDTPAGWIDTVADQVWKLNVTLGNMTEGRHVLTWRVNSPEIYLEKIVLNLRKGAVRESYLGVPETTLV
ncbi:uncharacterized protein HMPREF1541_04129 [Cyphellophora europaea CBS 101466]|uniref:Gylcosyl hydrolase 115 C-terminal domain-containing protein n=1 Tax=Cyphellophora europaea (strain CBS 101466) TaxID=1220924 RepID=W2S2B1_CYPE1|nr:uncharacterized protein HMPREF1541_04129 [Cyphellophora europaea CBS 101466]ETN42188.1 hypothetical protein HMPREF1541_04129 [Cyphellophora europaea CBS 101466]